MTLEPDPTWTAIDQEYTNLVSSYTIERGRSFELDRTDTGRATVSVADKDGILDPTNTSGPFYLKIQPLLQIMLARRNPVTGEWHSRYRGFIEDFTYGFDPSQRVNRLVISCVDIFEIITSIEMHPGHFGVAPPAQSAGQVFFEDTTTPYTHDGMQLRVQAVQADTGIPDFFFVVFSGNIDVHETTYSPGESAMTAIAEAVDAEFPGVGNAYTDRFGRLAVHGRYARFDPLGTAATVTPDRWDFHDWNAGDGARVNAHPTDTAHIRAFAFNLGLAKMINRGLATPIGIPDADVAAQVYQDTTSIGTYGIRGWTAQNLITKNGVTDGLIGPGEDKAECKLFAKYYVDNFAYPLKRITDIGFRSMNPADTRAGANWDFLSRCDISDRVYVWISSPGGGFFDAEPFFIEGITEDVKPLNPDYDDVTLSLDLSPGGYFQFSPFAPAP